MEKSGARTTEKAPCLVAHYRPLGLKAVVAATAVKGKVLDDKQQAEGRSLDGKPDERLDIPIYD